MATIDEVKKDCWEIDVSRQSTLKVCFDEPVTAKEAMRRTSDQEYEDIIDEEDHGMEVVGAR